MTERNRTGLTPAQLDRVAQLRARRGQTAPPPEPPPDTALLTSDQTDPVAAPKLKRRRKRHVAQGGRIVAAGLGASTMLGIVGVLGLDNAAATNDTGTGAVTPVVQNPAPPPIRLVVHRIPAARSAAPSQPAAPASGDAVATPAPAEPAAPIVLTAQPIVQTVTVAAPSQANSPTPEATTRGSN